MKQEKTTKISSQLPSDTTMNQPQSHIFPSDLEEQNYEG